MLLKATISLVEGGIGALSVNQLYINRRQGGRSLSPTGRTFKRRIVAQLATKWLLTTTLDNMTEYDLQMVFHFPRIYNEGWPDKAKTRFKKIDVTNFVKFFQDCIAAGSGIDDSSHFKVTVEKREDPINPRVEIEMSELGET